MEVAFISGKGGTGKSCICAAFATLGHPVVVADCDVDAANLYLVLNPEQREEEVFHGGHKAVIDAGKCTLCGDCIPYCRFGAISRINGNIEISPIACDGCHLCSRICREKAITMVSNDESRLRSGTFRYGKMVYGWLAPGEENSGKMVSRIKEKAKKLAVESQVPVILLDGPPGIGCPVISTIAGANQVIIITEPTHSGYSDLKRVAGIVAASRANTAVIINKYDLNMELTEIIRNWCQGQNLPVIGNLPYDRQVITAMVNGKSITEWAPGSGISENIKAIWEKLLTA